MPLDLSNIRPRVSVDQIENQIACDPVRYLEQLRPAAEIVGPYYKMINPTRSDSTVGSFYYHTKNNFWKDWATNDGGYRFISLVRYLKGMNFSQAIDWTLNLLGGTATTGYQPRPTAPKVNNHQIVMPVPLTLASYVTQHWAWGKPDYSWEYRDIHGRLLMYRNRYNKPDGRKSFCPFTLWETRLQSISWTAWANKDIPGPRPLYRLDFLGNMPGAPVLICEGEKSVDAAQLMLPDMVCMTSPCGSGAANRADWSPLAGWEVLIWPDNDEAGMRYAHEVANLVTRVGANAKIMNLSVFGEISKGWDAHDALMQGVSVATIRGAMS